MRGRLRERVTGYRGIALVLSGLLVWVATATPVAAQQSQGSQLRTGEVGQPDPIRVYGGIRLQQGEAGERVFLGPLLLSDLTWDIQDLYFAGGGVVWQPASRWAFQAQYWHAITDGSGGMTDYDYLLPSIWTDFSDGRVEVNSSYEWDVRGIWEAWQGRSWGLQAIGGFQRLFWDWSQFGGDYIYSGEGFRDLHGSFPAQQNGINYRQTFEIPYVGIGGRLDGRDWNGALRCLYSPFVQAEAWDEHVQRNLYFEDTFRNITYLAVEGSLRYLIGQHVFVQGELDWHHIPEAHGDLKVIDPAAGTEEVVSDAGGIENQAMSVTLAVGARW